MEIKTASDALRARAATLRMVVFDVDGVMTDGRFLLDESGNEYKSFNTQDGYGLRRLMDAGIAVAIITGRNSGAVTKRAQELGIEHVFQGSRQKRDTIQTLIDALETTPEYVAAVGDDIPDLEMFAAAKGLRFAVANAVTAVLDHADLVTTRAGGFGAVREIADFILDARSQVE
ncbi:MAG: HAD hydrolase family protein [Pseudomonadota bacterium]